jgi:hypothetical protein
MSFLGLSIVKIMESEIRMIAVNDKGTREQELLFNRYSFSLYVEYIYGNE